MKKDHLEKARAKLLGLCLFICFLHGCTPTSPNQQSTYHITYILTKTATQTLTPRKPTYTKTITKSPTISLLPSSTPNRTQTSVAKATLSAYQTQFAPQIATETARASLAIEFPNICSNDPDAQLLLSPDERYLATACWVSSKMIVLEKGGIEIASVKYDEIFSDADAYPANIGELIPLHWEKDNRYLYFTRMDCCWDGQSLSTDYSGPLYRLDTQSNQWNMIVLGYMKYFSFSPSGKRLVYIDEFTSPLTINIIDLKTGESHTIPVNGYNEGAYIVWSPDEKSFALTTAFGIDWDSFGTRTVMLCSMDNEACIRVTGETSDSIYPIEWTTDNILHVHVGSNTISIDLVAEFYITPIQKP